MHLDSIFISNILGLYGTAGAAWTKALHTLLTHLAEQWNFHFLEAMPDITYHIVPGIVSLMIDRLHKSLKDSSTSSRKSYDSILRRLRHGPFIRQPFP